MTLPAGWKSVPSDRVTVPAGGTVAAQVPVVVPLDLVAGPVAATVERPAGGRDAGLGGRQPGVRPGARRRPAVLDHVDFGNAPRRRDHALQASASSGTNTEAGYTRRYANSGNPGAWYSATVDVTPDKPFVLRNIETFDGARTKKYHVYVDDTLVKTQLVPRTETGAGIKVYDLLVDDPAVLANDGNVRVKFEYPLDASGFFDPSIADLWVLGVPADTQAPDVSAMAASGTVGDAGWFRSDATVAVTAADNRDDAPVVETGDGGDLAGVRRAGDGVRRRQARAVLPGHRRGRERLRRPGRCRCGSTRPHRRRRWPPRVAPGSRVRTPRRWPSPRPTPSAGWRRRSTASTVATGPRSGAGTVTVQGFGEHVVDFASTDVAGNPEVVRHQTVDLADVDTVQALVAPQVTGAAKYGATLTATTGSWNTKGLSFGYQWLRDGAAVAGCDRDVVPARCGRRRQADLGAGDRDQDRQGARDRGLDRHRPGRQGHVRHQGRGQQDQGEEGQARQGHASRWSRARRRPARSWSGSTARRSRPWR